MPTAIAIRFPLGRYHATPWDRAVNEGETEWPPSPWRLLRALVSTRHLRWPELPEDRLDAMIGGLAVAPPAYLTPPTSPAHTRHYMPDLAHKSGLPSTDLVLDPFLWMNPHEPLIVRWEVELPDEAKGDLAKLCELVPYIGRSESLASVELLHECPDPDEAWWQVDSPHRPVIRLLLPAPEISRKDLEITTSEVRRRRLPLPPHTNLQSYGRRVETSVTVSSRQSRSIQAIRWRLETKGPFREQDGILATEWLRTSRIKRAEWALGVLPSSLTGKVDSVKVDDRHAHAHWLWMAKQGRVAELALVVPGGGLDPAVAGSIVADSAFTGHTGWNPNGFRSGQAHVVAMGDPEWVLWDFVGPSDIWVGETPYLPVRHRKRRQSLEQWIQADIAQECAYRGLPEPVQIMIADVSPRSVEFRRYRWRESMAARRQGYWVGVRFADPVQAKAVLSLGQLNHFGFGLFAPER